MSVRVAHTRAHARGKTLAERRARGPPPAAGAARAAWRPGLRIFAPAPPVAPPAALPPPPFSCARRCAGRRRRRASLPLLARARRGAAAGRPPPHILPLRLRYAPPPPRRSPASPWNVLEVVLEVDHSRCLCSSPACPASSAGAVAATEGAPSLGWPARAMRRERRTSQRWATSRACDRPPTCVLLPHTVLSLTPAHGRVRRGRARARARQSHAHLGLRAARAQAPPLGRRRVSAPSTSPPSPPAASRARGTLTICAGAASARARRGDARGGVSTGTGKPGGTQSTRASTPSTRARGRAELGRPCARWRGSSRPRIRRARSAPRPARARLEHRRERRPPWKSGTASPRRPRVPPERRCTPRAAS